MADHHWHGTNKGAVCVDCGAARSPFPQPACTGAPAFLSALPLVGEFSGAREMGSRVAAQIDGDSSKDSHIDNQLARNPGALNAVERAAPSPGEGGEGKGK